VGCRRPATRAQRSSSQGRSREAYALRPVRREACTCECMPPPPCAWGPPAGCPAARSRPHLQRAERRPVDQRASGPPSRRWPPPAGRGRRALRPQACPPDADSWPGTFSNVSSSSDWLLSDGANEGDRGASSAAASGGACAGQSGGAVRRRAPAAGALWRCLRVCVWWGEGGRRAGRASCSPERAATWRPRQIS
jgi:hypothetical protein